VTTVEVHLEAKGYAIASIVDIEGAFDSTSKVTQEQAMNTNEVPETIVDWVENMLAART
jgi:hypothetical protein